MRHEVVLVEQLGALGRLWYQTLSLADVAHDDVAHVGVQLLSRQLQVLIRTKLFLPQLCQPPNLLPPLFHQLLFAIVVSLVLCDAALMVGLVCLGADRVDLYLTLPVLLRAGALGDSLRPGCIAIHRGRAHPGSLGPSQLRLRLRGPIRIPGTVLRHRCPLLHDLITIMLIVLKLDIAFDPAPLLRARIVLTKLLLVRQVRKGWQRWLGAFIIELWRLTVLELFQVCTSSSLI